MSKLLRLELSQGTAKSVRIGKIPSPIGKPTMLPLNRLLAIGVRSFKKSDALCTTAANLVTRRACHDFPFS